MESFTISLNKNAQGDLQSGIANPNAVRHGSIVDFPGSGFGSMPSFIFVGGKNGRLETKSIGVDNINSDGWTVNTERPKYIYDDSERGHVWHCPIWDGDGGTADDGTIAHNWGSQIPEGSKIFLHWKVKFNCDATQYQWKHIRQESTYNFEDGGPESYIFLWKKTTGRFFASRPMVAAGTATTRLFTGLAYNAIRIDGAPEWFGFNHYQVVATEGLSNGIRFIESLVSSGPVTLLDITDMKDFDTGVTARPQWHVFQNYLGSYLEGNPTVGDVYMDDVFIQVAPPGGKIVRIFACNKPSFSDSDIIREIQEPADGWTDTNAQIIFNRGGLTNGQWHLIAVEDKNTQIGTMPITLVD